jgi:plasmid maintenance system antidote protein VapI
MSTSSIITRTRRPSAPGEILAELYLEPRTLGHRARCRAGLSRKHVSNIIHGRASITAETGPGIRDQCRAVAGSAA